MSISADRRLLTATLGNAVACLAVRLSRAMTTAYTKVRVVVFRLLPLGLMLASCAPVPTFDNPGKLKVSNTYPTIQPLNEALAKGGDPQIELTDPAALQARAAGLRSRAGSLEAGAADPATRARLDAAIAASGG